MKFRPDPNEALIVCLAASFLPETDRVQLLLDLYRSKVEYISDELTRFHISGYRRFQETIKRPYEISLAANDKDGSLVVIELLSDINRRLYEIEFTKLSQVSRDIDINWQTLRVSV